MKSLNNNAKRFLAGSMMAALLCAAAVGLGARLREWVAPPAAGAQGASPWTAVGASGTVDESSINTFGFTNASAGYGANASVLPLEYRYNIVNVHHFVSAAGAIPNIQMPGWTTLEFGAQAPATSTATAYLYRVNRCTGQQVLLCAVQHGNTPAPGNCRTCQFANNSFNFSSYLYYVRVVLDRNTANEQPMAHTLRVY